MYVLGLISYLIDRPGDELFQVDNLEPCVLVLTLLGTLPFFLKLVSALFEMAFSQEKHLEQQQSPQSMN